MVRADVKGTVEDTSTPAVEDVEADDVVVGAEDGAVAPVAVARIEAGTELVIIVRGDTDANVAVREADVQC